MEKRNTTSTPRLEELRGYALLGKEVVMSCGSCKTKKPKKKVAKKKKK